MSETQPTRRGFLKAAGLGYVAMTIAPAATSAKPAGKNPTYKFMPPTNEIFGWIKDLWKFGDDGKYGFRMPGTPADHKAVDYMLKKFK